MKELLKSLGIKQIVGLDFETYYDKDYTLRKMSTTEYIRDPRFKVQSVSLQTHRQKGGKGYGTADSISRAIHNIDWSVSGLLCHHTHFDGLILSHHYGVCPKFNFCTLSMARPLHGNAIRNDLDTVARHYGVGNKLEDILAETKGVRDLPRDLLKRLIEYNDVDVDIMWKIFREMLQCFPIDELKLIDHTVRSYTDPVLKVNKSLATREHKSEQAKRGALVASTGVSEKELRSRDKFAQLLRNLGVEPPKKISHTTGKETYAFAKDDLGLQKLKIHKDERVRNLIEARLLCASPINETRAARLLSHVERGNLPIYLKYGGAHTLRWSGGDKMNPQNFPRDSKLRNALKAPPGHVLIIFDSGQIEARVNAWLAGQTDLLEQFRAKDAGDETQDPYKIQATDLFGVPYDSVEKIQRFVGKTVVLGCGYQMGGPKLHHTLVSGKQGPPVDCTLDEAYGWINAYRARNDKIVTQWDFMQDSALPAMGGYIDPIEYRDVLTFEDGGYWSPNGMFMSYPNIRAEAEFESQLFNTVNYADFKYKADTNLYGGKMTENVVQNLARHVVAYQILPIADLYRLVLQVHDEGVWCVHRKQADEAFELIDKAFRTPPSWAPDLPVIGEGEISPHYVKP